MMYKKKKGFSLAELLISLLVISIVLAAAIPTITKRNSAGSEKIWHWAGANNSVYSAIGANQSVMIGANQMPHRELIANASPDTNYYELFFKETDIELPTGTATRPFFTTDGDKLVLLKRSLGGNNQTDNFVNSHISFYNLENSSTATTRDITYAGRIATDEHNLAFGIGSLQQLHTADKGNAGTFKGYNTAIGHYSLFYNTIGERNTAIGEKTLTYNVTGSNNTALGYNALKLSRGDNNTALGTEAMRDRTGTGNTAVGSYALRFKKQGDNDYNYNTAIGSGACSHIVGSHNICIGFAAGGGVENPSDDQLIEDDNYLVIGNDPEGAPLVEGHTSYLTDGTKDKHFNINAKFFNVQPFDASAPILQVISNSGDPLSSTNGYAAGDGYTKFGDFRFTLKEIFGPGDGLQLRLTGEASGTHREAKIVAYDHHNTGADLGYADFNLNDSLFILMPENTASSTDGHVAINTSDDNKLGIQKTIYITEGNNFSMTIDNSSGFQLIEKDSSYEKSSLRMNNGEVSVSADQSVSISTSWAEFTDSSNNTIIGFDVTGGDITLQGLSGTTSGDTSLVGTVNKIYTELSELRSLITTYSDARLKNISSDSTAGLKEINALEVKNYTYKNDKEKTPHVGVIAQQLQKVFPNSVTKDENGYLKIRTEEIFYAMVNSIKELFTQIQDLTAKITGLDKRITELEEQNKALKKQNEEFEKRLAKLEKQAAK